MEAESHCQSEGGHLASVTSEEEHRMVAAVAEYKVWIGGSDQEEEGVWRWSDGSKWDYHRWLLGDGKQGGMRNCVKLEGGQGYMMDADCTNSQPLICQFDIKILLKRKKLLQLTYNKEQLTFHFFTVL